MTRGGGSSSRQFTTKIPQWICLALFLLGFGILVEGAVQGNQAHTGLQGPAHASSRSLLQSNTSGSPGTVQQIYSSPRAGSATSGNSLQSLVPALRGAFSMVSQPPSSASSPTTSSSSSIIVIDGTALINGSSLGPLTAELALRLRCIQWNVLKDDVYDFQMLTVNYTNTSSPAAPQVAGRFRYVLRNALSSNANFQDLLGWAANLPSNFSMEARQLYGWNLGFVLQTGNIVRKINAASLPDLDPSVQSPVPANVTVMALNVSLTGTDLVAFNISHQTDLLTAYLQVLSGQGLLWADLSHISEDASPAYSSSLGSLSSRRLLRSSSAGHKEHMHAALPDLPRQLLQTSAATPAAAATAPTAAPSSSGVHMVTLGMHLIFSADNTGANGSTAQAALDIARSQQDVRNLLQAQGLAWGISLMSLGVAVPHAQARDVQLYSGRDVGVPSPVPSQNAAAPLASNDRVTFVPSGAADAAAGHSGLSTSPILGIVLGCAAALILATLLGCLLTHRKQLRAAKHSFKTWQKRDRTSKNQEHDGGPHDALRQIEAESGKGSAKAATDKSAVRPSKAQTRLGGINPEDTAALETADFMMTTQDSTSMASEPVQGSRGIQSAGLLSPQASSPSSDSMVLLPRTSIHVANPAERLQLLMQSSAEHERVLQRWQAQEENRAISMGELAAFAQYRLKEGKLFKGHVMSGELCKSQEHVLCKAVRADRRTSDVTIKLFAFSAGLLSEQGACQEVSCGRVMPRALARCPEELDVDGGTTPACMLLEPVGRTLADRLSQMASEPLAPQEQVSMLAGLCAAVHAFHARDLVLCNLQPEHFAWVPSKQPGWRLLNCSWWVRKGVAARPSYTLQFAAPELIAGDGQEVAGVIADPACDMWSLGVIAFHILSGRAFLPPRRFSNELVIAMGLGHLTYPFEARQDYFDDVTPELQPLLASLLSREPHKRPTISQVVTSQPLAPIFADQAMAMSAAFTPQAPFLPSRPARKRPSPQKLSPRTQLRNQRLQAPRSLIPSLPSTGYPPIMSGYLAVAHENSVSASTSASSPLQTTDLGSQEMDTATEGRSLKQTPEDTHAGLKQQPEASLQGGLGHTQVKPNAMLPEGASSHVSHQEFQQHGIDFSEITPAPLPPRQTARHGRPAGDYPLSGGILSGDDPAAAAVMQEGPSRGRQNAECILDSAHDQHRANIGQPGHEDAAMSPGTPQQHHRVLTAETGSSDPSSNGKSSSSSAGDDFQCMLGPQHNVTRAVGMPSIKDETAAGVESLEHHVGKGKESTGSASRNNAMLRVPGHASDQPMALAASTEVPADETSTAFQPPQALTTLTVGEQAALGMSQMNALQPESDVLPGSNDRPGLIPLSAIAAPAHGAAGPGSTPDGVRRNGDASFMTASSVMSLASASSYQPSSYATASSTMSAPRSALTSQHTFTGFGPGVTTDTAQSTPSLMQKQTAACAGPVANVDLDVDDHDISTSSTALSLSLGHYQHEQELSPAKDFGKLQAGALGLVDRTHNMAQPGFDDSFDLRGGQLSMAVGNLDSQDMDRDDGWSSADSSVYEAARDISCAASLADSELEQPGPMQGMSALEALQNAGLNMTA